MGRMQRRSNRAFSNVECRRDARIIEIRVVAEKQRQPLAFRQRSHRRAHRIAKPVLTRVGDVTRIQPARELIAAAPPSGIHNQTPDPRLERSLSPERAAVPHRVNKRILNRVSSPTPIANRRTRDPQEHWILLPVEQLKLGQRATPRSHISMMLQHPLNL